MQFYYLTIILLTSLIKYSTSVCNVEGFLYQKNLEEYNNDTGKVENVTKNFYEHDTIICEDITLIKNQELPTLEKGYAAKILLCPKCHLEEITVGNLNQFTELQEIYFNNSFIKNIESGVFINQTKIKKLHLEQNIITELPETFLKDTTLDLVDISQNKINTLHTRSFKNLEIATLNLSFNLITEVLDKHFKNVTILASLDLSNNNITHFKLHESVVFNVSLNLSHNELQKIDFQELTGSVYLDYNKIHQINKTNPLLRHLSLGFNSLKTIPANVFVESTGLLYLSLQNNSLNHTDIDAFVGLKQLKNLNLAHNKIHNIKVGLFRDLHNLTLLNLSSNHLSAFQFETITNLVNLRTLDISNNKLKHMHLLFFNPLQKLERLNINQIHLKELHVQKLFNIFPNLKVINLNHNQLLCEQLLHIITFLQDHNVSLITGNSFESKNINGFKCIEDVAETDYENLSESNLQQRREFQNEVENKNEDMTKNLIKEIHILSSVSICVLVFVVILIILKLLQEFQRFTYMRKYKYRLVNSMNRRSVSNR